MTKINTFYDLAQHVERPLVCSLSRPPPVFCWTHVRRRFVKRFENEGSSIAEEMLRQIAALYQFEKTVRGGALPSASQPDANIPPPSSLRSSVTARLGPPGTAAEGVHLGLTDVGIVVGNDVNRLRQIRLPPYRLRLSAASSSTAAAHGAD
jgi:hypothetical protein